MKRRQEEFPQQIYYKQETQKPIEKPIEKQHVKIQSEVKFGTFNLVVTPLTVQNQVLEYCDYVGYEQCWIETFPETKHQVYLK